MSAAASNLVTLLVGMAQQQVFLIAKIQMHG